MLDKVDNRLAVIDLGSNTFHLLIVDLDADNQIFSEVYRLREYVYLAQSGIEELSSQAMLRGLKCLALFLEKAKEYSATTIIAIGTSAIRSARNGKDFVEHVHSELGIKIEVIEGVREAQLIFKGITSFLRPKLRNYNLIVDVGGGSVEVILTDCLSLLRSWSFNCGISVLRNVWQRNDPPTEKDRLEFTKIVDAQVGNHLDVLSQYSIENMVGGSGPFEIVESYFGLTPNPYGNKLKIDQLRDVIDLITSNDKASRLQIKGMSASRHDLSMESMMLLDYLLSKTPSETGELIVSQYALKEGIIAESLNLD